MMLTPEMAISLLNNGDHLRIIHREEICKLIHDLLKQLAAANARIAELEKQNADLFPYYQDHLEGALIPATEYQQWIKRAEQTEAQCAAIVAAYQNMKGDFEHWAYCELIDSPPGKKCTCGVWELVAAIEAALEVKP